MTKHTPRLPILAKVLIGIVLVALPIPFLATVWALLGMDANRGGNALEWQGQAAPELVVSTIDGRSLRLSDLKGQRVIVDFWATWCPPCVREIPHFQQLSEEFDDDELIVIGVSTEDAATVRAFATSHQITYPLGNPVQIEPPFTDINAVPTTIFIDHRGFIETVLQGYHSYNDLRSRAIGPVD